MSRRAPTAPCLPCFGSCGRRSCRAILAAVFVESVLFAAGAARADATTTVFVQDGAARGVHFVGEPWKQHPGYLEGFGMHTRLVCGRALGEGDFHIKAELSLPRLLRVAPALGIGRFSHFEFDANGGRLIVGGPLFVPDEQMIRYTIVGKNDGLIEAGKPFLLEVVRRGDGVRFSINGKPVHSQKLLRGRVGPVSVFPGHGVGPRCAVRVHNLSVTGRLEPYELPHMTAAGVALDERVRWLPHLIQGPFTKLPDGRIMAVSGGDVRVSADDGETWNKWPIKIVSDKNVGSGGGIPLCTRDGTIVLLFIDTKDRESLRWDEAQRKATAGRLNVWVMRSEDLGQTWIDPQMLYEGYCGALIDMIQTSGGSIVAPVQEFLFTDGRSATRTYVSQDDGRTWRRGNLLDIGGSGNHDGAFEPTIAELPDGRTWMLMRTNLDYLWSAYSDNIGLYWTRTELSRFDASSSPAQLTRLADGRLVLVWNRLYPEGRNTYRRRVGKWSDRPVSWCREELSITISDARGENWTEPVVIARKPGGTLAYIHVFEHRPGRLWITTGGSGLRLDLSVADFSPEPKPSTSSSETE